MVLELIKNRWSPVSFSEKMIEDEKLKDILEAARYAPSSMNEQPWLFVLTTRDEKEAFDNIVELLNEGNRVWAKYCSAFIVSFARKKHDYNQKANRYFFFDTGMAVSNMLHQATNDGIFAHQMGGFSVEKAREYFLTGEDTEPVAIMALGYPGNGSGLTEEIYLRDSKRRPRKDLSEYAFRNKINNPAF